MIKNIRLFLAILLLGIETVNAQYTDLHNFNGTLGQHPYGNLTISGSALYGMVSDGGKYNWGCIFSIDSNGSNYKDLWDFTDTVLTNGATPYGSLTLSGSVLYGMTIGGGANGYGIIFSIHTDGSGFKDLWDFDDTGSNGANPEGSLTLSGNILYGMTAFGGKNNYGNIFSIHTDGSNYTGLVDFNVTNGKSPNGSLTLSGTVLYGMTLDGGPLNYGNIFSVNTNGSGFKNLLDFNGTNGYNPYGDLTLSGNVLYGMTYQGGINGDGNIFSIHTNGSGFKDLFDFNGTNGDNPEGSLTLSGKVLYGMTLTGLGYGNIFSIDTTGGALTNLLGFAVNINPNGSNPYGSLTLSGGRLFGMTYGGGTPSYSGGVIFVLNDEALGISEFKLNSSSVNVYPNPSNGLFNIEVKSEEPEAKSIEVFNVLGEKVYSKSYQPSAIGYQLDLSNQSNGIYLIRILNSDGTLVGQKKVVKTN